MDLVINASPLILLCKVGLHDLLPQLGSTVCIPEGVVAEINAEPADPASCVIARSEWLRRVTVQVPDAIKAWDLGRGESEVLAYAASLPHSRPLLDDAEGKACALALGMKPLGTGGFLVLAKRAGLLDSVGRALSAMRAEGLWISDAVCVSILELAGE